MAHSWASLSEAHSQETESWCWLLEGASVPCHDVITTGLLEYPCNMVAGFFQRGRSRRARQKSQWLLSPSFGSHTPLFLKYSIGSTVQLYSVWEGTAQSMWMLGVDICGHLGGWLLQWLYHNLLISSLVNDINYFNFKNYEQCFYAHSYSCSGSLMHMGKSFSRGRLLGHRVCAFSDW